MKKLLVAALAVALTAGAAAAQTTMTMTGYVKVIPDASNTALGGPIAPVKDSNMQYLVDQRTRLFFNLNSADKVGATIALEINSPWGVQATTTAKPLYKGFIDTNANGRRDTTEKETNNTAAAGFVYWPNATFVATGVGRTGGGQFDTDDVTIRVKDALLWFKPGDNTKISAGLTNVSDNFAGILLQGADMGGVLVSQDFSKSTNLKVGLFDWREGNTGVLTSGNAIRNASTWFVPVMLNTKIGDGNAGVDYYFVRADGAAAIKAAPYTTYTDSVVGQAKVHYLGAYYNGVAGNLKYNVYGLYNWGEVNQDTTSPDVVRAAVAHAQVDMKVASGNLRLRGLYVQGGDGANNAIIDKYNSIVVYGASIALATNDLLILMKSTDDCNTIRSLNAMDVRQNGFGTILYYAAFDTNVSEKGNIKFTAGHLGTDKADAKGQRALANELSGQYNYKFSKELTLNAGVGYGFLNAKHSNYDAGEENVLRIVARASYAF